MHTQYNEKISDMKKCIQKKNKLKLLLKQTEQDIIKEKLLLNKLSDELEKKNQDVLKLESKNITSLFYAILGIKEERLDKDRQKLLKSKLKYDQCINNMNYLVNESKKIVHKISEIEGCDSQYEELINKKLKIINLEDKETNEELKKLIKRKENMSANIIEIDEAINYGEKALNSIEIAIKKLELADGWGVTDILEGSTSEDKYNNIDDAREYAEQAQRMLGKFKREMSDIVMMTGTEIPVGTFDSFADQFFDSLIYDWVVNSDIGKTLDVVKNIKNQLDKAMSKLYEEKVTEEFMIKQIEEQINYIIENA
ncbi:MAG TPA: hypothetical protein GX396_08865 [Tissierellia bacterium]|nr:hypothetical protein [Tissierellia bacterium]